MSMETTDKNMNTKVKEDLELLVKDIMSLSMSGLIQAIYFEYVVSAWRFDDIIRQAGCFQG